MPDFGGGGTLSPLLSGYCLPGSCVWCLSPGASPPVMEIPSSRRVVRVFFWGMRSAYPVTEVPSFRRVDLVCSCPRALPPVIEILPFRQGSGCYPNTRSAYPVIEVPFLMLSV